MNSITTILQYGHNKHCFLSLVDSFQRKHSSKTTVSDSRIDNEIVVYEVELSESRKAYLSLFGKPYKLVSGDRVQLNGLFADKLRLRDEDPLVLKEIKSAVPSARRLQVEPMTVDDWEILEENSGRVETVLLDQVRVVWPGQILPVWIQRSICLFMKVVSVEPMAPCVVLENSSEIVVTPKVRSHPPPSSLTLPSNQKVASLTAQWQQRQKNQEAKSKQDHSTKLSKSSQEQQNNISSPCKARSMQDFNTDNENDLSVNENTLEPRLVPRSPSRSPRTSFKKMSSLRQKSVLSSSDPMNERGEMNRPLVRRQSSLMESVMKYIFPFITERRDDSDSHSESDAGSAIDYSMRNLPSRNGVLRIQPMKLSCSLDKCFSKTELSKSLSGYRGTQVLSTHSEEGKTCVVPCEIFQPSTVYVDAECTKNERLLHPYLPHLPNNFIARIQKIPSPQEKTEMSQKEGVKGKSDGKGNVEPKIPLVDDDSSTEPKMSTEQLKGDVTGINSGSCYVRVVAIDRKAGLTEDAWQEGADRVLSEQPLLYGHVIVPDQLRRQLKLDTTSLVWLQTGSVDLIIPRKVCIYPLTALPKKVTNDNLISAFKHYIKKCADADHPLVVFQGLFLKYMLFPGTFVEVQVTFYGENDVSGVKAVTMLSELNIDSVLITIQKEPKEDKMNVINTMLAYCHTNDFDPQPLPVKLKQLGGMADLAARAMCHLHIALGSRPLGRNTFQARAGLCHGILLITGPRGSGKTSLVKGLCRKMSHLPVLAYITMIDCKTLRGKTVSHIQRILEAVFDEAAWREPSIIVFDNIDVIIPAPSGPETEMNGEALYSAKNSQVLQGLLAYEIENNSRVAVMATSISRNSLHSSLVESVGKAFIQKTLNIGTPDKEARVKILTSLMQNQNAITTETLKTLDLGPIALRTEGYVARDLESLVNRALHNRLVTDSEAFKEKITLNMEDFEAALCKFKPVSMRNVPLHKAGELGWHDVGGLTSVKTALVETLLWPSKYPQLFDSCPLRLRSGILLYGAPGTGKTLLAGVVAKECGLNFISIKGPELLSKYIGASEQAVRDLFTRAQSAKPCILFFDEFDSIAPKRGHDSTGVTDRVVNQLLTQLDGVEGLQGVYVLGATSRPDLIDPALLRPGRLDKCLHCQLPDKMERGAILQSLTRKMTLCSDVDLEEVADICTNFTGADLKALLYNAQLCAIHDDADEDRDLHDSVVRIKGDDEQCSIIDNCSPVLDNTVVASSSPRSAQKSPSDNLSHSDGDGKTLHEQKTEDLAQNLNSSHVLEKEIVTYLKTMGDQVPDESTKVSDGVSQTYENHRQSTTSIASDEKRSRLVRQDEIADKSGMKVKVLSSQTSNRSTNSLGFLPSENQLRSVSSQDGIEQENSETNFADHIPSSEVFDEDENDDDSSHSNAGPNEPPLSLNGDAIQADWQDLERQSQVQIKVTKSSTSETPEGPAPYPDPASTYPPPTTKRKRGCERHNSYTPGEALKTELGSKSPSVERPVTVYTSLEHGLATLSAEDEARYLAMVKEIQRRDESLFQAANAKRRDLPTRSSILVQVCRHHLLDTARTMRPSVSAAEREKYQTIYENFVSSRTGQFDKKVTPQDEKRATLA